MSNHVPSTRGQCVEADASDPLGAFRDRFQLPEGVIYLDGNSLGALPKNTLARVGRTITDEWGLGLIRSWNDASWFTKPTDVGDRIAPLVGAASGEVVVADSTSASLFQVLVSALRMRPDRSVVVSERDNFPTDLYMIQGTQELLAGADRDLDRRLIHDDGPSLDEVLADDVSAVVLTHVNYRTGRMYDMAAVAEKVHAAGALVIWDLCHSVGAVPVDLNAADADFAIGCTYKYLNGGPGSPSFLWVPARHQDAARPALTGWQGHAKPFDFTVDYEPAPGITRFRVGTPQLLSLAGLEASLDVWADVDMQAVRTKSLALTDLFIALVETRLAAYDLEIVTPRDHDRRGSQVSLRIDGGYQIMQALIARGVIGDFRAPDLMRFGFTPLYLGYADVWDAVSVLEEILTSGVWQDERFARRGAVS
ncbi:kynureninase [Calidifontibacter indicus]|uniref:Kynureninase n=1 Tax=Calidifontibacter indicus TaxID=419650 RepID=A0A3D9UJ60_9MICO|nr:kynureninase [Calidifontibacter indicus]REF29337.1 kynureninase [Calidifontibacter indicus]